MDVNERMAKARAARKSSTQQTPMEVYLKDRESLRKSINAFCWTCVGESKKEVQNCTAYQCPLHRVRPWQGKDDCGKDD